MKNKINISIGIGCLSSIFLSWWTDRTLDFFFFYFTGKEIDIPFILSFLVNLFTGVFAIIANLISEIVKICIS